VIARGGWALAGLLLLAGCWADFPDQPTDSGNRDSAGDSSQRDSLRRDSQRRDGQPPQPDGDTSDGQPPDVAPPDLEPDQPPFSCTAEAFRRCDGDDAIFCNETGDGEVTTPCAPFPCNQAAGRCDLCTAGAPPACKASDDGFFVSCPDGLPVETACANPCVDAVDSDSDSQSECAGDCNDGNPLVFSGQTSFFVEPIPGAAEPVKWDYNCDGQNEVKLPDRHPGKCYGRPKDACDTVVGWYKYGSVPKCGENGWWWRCRWSKHDFCDVDTEHNKPQVCR